MQIESILRSVLVADPAVAAQVSGRAYQTALPREPTFPAVTYQMVSRVQDSLTGIVQARMQYTCLAMTWKGAADLADAVRCGLHGYRGVRRRTDRGDPVRRTARRPRRDDRDLLDSGRYDRHLPRGDLRQ